MSPDDKRADSEAEGRPSSDDPRSGTVEARESVVDDLEALAVAGGLSPTSPSEPAKDVDDETNLGALAAVSGRREGNHADDDSRLDLGHLVAVARQSLPPVELASVTRKPAEAERLSALRTPLVLEAQPASLAVSSRPRAAWLVPLLIGLGIGLGIAAGLFVFAGSRSPVLPQPVARLDAPAPSAQLAAPPSQATPPSAPSAEPSVDPATSAVPAVTVATPMPTTSAPAPTATPTRAPERVLANTATVSHSTISARPAPAAPSAAATPATMPSGTPPLAKDATQASSPSPTAGPTPVLPGEEADRGSNASAESGAKTGPSRSVDALLDEALAPSARRAAAERQRDLALEQEQLQPTPTRDDVTQAMTVLLPAIRGCAMGQSGLATAGIVVRGDGRVASVEVTGAPFAGTASGRCMEGVIRRARFPRFKQPAFRIRFPLAIQ